MESHEKEQNRSKIALSSSSPLFVTPTPTTLLFERRLHRLYHPILLLQTCTITDRLLESSIPLHVSAEQPPNNLCK